MDFNELVVSILNIVLIPLLVALTGYGVAWLKAKAKSANIQSGLVNVDFYIDKLNESVLEAVGHINQTYVGALKAENVFDKDAQGRALKDAKNLVLLGLSQDAYDVLQHVYSDINKAVETKIEAVIDDIHKATPK